MCPVMSSQNISLVFLHARLHSAPKSCTLDASLQCPMHHVAKRGEDAQNPGGSRLCAGVYELARYSCRIVLVRQQKRSSRTMSERDLHVAPACWVTPSLSSLLQPKPEPAIKCATALRSVGTREIIEKGTDSVRCHAAPAVTPQWPWKHRRLFCTGEVAIIAVEGGLTRDWGSA